MKRMLALYKLARPFNGFSSALAVFLGGYVARTDAWLQVVMAGAVTFLVTGAGNTWNDYLDIEIDRINRPDRVLPSGQVSRRAALIFGLGLNAVALVISAFINTPAFLVSLVASAILYVYSWKLKSTVLLGNLTVAIVSAMSVIFGGIAAGHWLPALPLAIIIFVAITGREILKTLADYEGDLRQRVRTISTAWGRRPARIFFFVIASATGMVMLVPHLLHMYRPVYAYIVAFGVFPVILYALVKVTRYSSGHQLERVSQLMKLDFLVWFVAVILGASA
jgi:geranylgeranylglycerol-phosphate geranylgeranyltransferase